MGPEKPVTLERPAAERHAGMLSVELRGARVLLRQNRHRPRGVPRVDVVKPRNTSPDLRKVDVRDE